MTLTIGVVSADGIAVAADSRTTLSTRPQRTYSGPERLHPQGLSGGERGGTFGWAFLEGRNIAGHMAALESSIAGSPMGVEELAEAIARFFGDAFDRNIKAGTDPAPHRA